MTAIKIATVSGSSHDTVEELVKIFDEALTIRVEVETYHTPLEAQKADFDRLLLLGGNDISPTLYGETATHAVAINSHRDSIECALVTRARDEGIPTMGICRGHQMIAAAWGGTLYQDFGKQVGTNHTYMHRLIDVIDPLAKRMPTHTVNSLHHQSVNKVPEGFTVLARSSDGIIESIGKPGVLGVQFHPEMHLETDDAWADLFCWFVLDGLSWDI